MLYKITIILAKYFQRIYANYSKKMTILNKVEQLFCCRIYVNADFHDFD